MLGHESEGAIVGYSAELAAEILHQSAAGAVADPLTEVVEPGAVSPPLTVPIPHPLDLSAKLLPAHLCRAAGCPAYREAALYQSDAIKVGKRNGERFRARTATVADVLLEGGRYIRGASRELAHPSSGFAQGNIVSNEVLGAKSAGPGLEALEVRIREGSTWKAGQE
jgi:hypothetical protein